MSGIELRQITKSYQKNPPIMENLDLTLRQGAFTVMLGPSGCGKSSILRMIAGLEKENSGEIFIGGRSMRGVEPYDRCVSMVFQNYALYPSMTVRQNMEFGLKNMKIPKAERAKRIAEVAEMVGLEEFLDRKPHQLSGGQCQRVALARAVVKQPEVLLMDEPLSNLDAKLRAQIRTELTELHHKLGATFVYVTHDQVEAMSMGDEIVVLNEGRVLQQDEPEQIYTKPKNLFVASFIGAPPMNILPMEKLTASGCAIPKAVFGANAFSDAAVSLGFRPESAKLLSIKAVNPDEHLCLQGSLASHEMLGDRIQYTIKTVAGTVIVKSDIGSRFDTDTVVAISADCICCFDAAGERLE